MNLRCLCRFKETIHWNPPHLLYVTLNRDDSAKTNPGKARAGGVIRDHNGKWLKGFSINLSITSNNIAQLWVVRYGLLMAWELGFRFIYLETDSTLVIQLLTSQISIQTLCWNVHGCI